MDRRSRVNITYSISLLDIIFLCHTLPRLLHSTTFLSPTNDFPAVRMNLTTGPYFWLVVSPRTAQVRYGNVHLAAE
jgi:hypothetical protein